MRTNRLGRKLLVRLTVLAVLAVCAALFVPRAAQMLLPTAAASVSGQDIVNAAERQLGATYCWDGGETSGATHGDGNFDKKGVREAYHCGDQSTVGFDCSGLVLYAVYQATHSLVLPHDSTKQWSYGKDVTTQAWQPGDVLFFGGSSFATSFHVGIYVSTDKMIDANTWGGDGVQYRGINATETGPDGLHFDGAIRFISAPPTLPAEPRNPRVASTSSSSAVLTWSDASNNEADFVTQYKTGNGRWVAGPPAASNATSVTVPGLSPNTPYTFQVGARNSAGTHWSAYATGRTASPPAGVTLPAQPGSPRVASTSSSSAVLTWTDASNNETGFATQYKTGSGGWVAGPTAGANATSVTVPGLSPNTPYTFQVGAQNSAGTHWSAYATGNTSAAGTTSTPPSSSGPALNYQVTNYDNDGTTGVYLRNSSNVDDVVRDSSHFLPYGTTVTLLCGGSGSSVGPQSNTAWDDVRVSDGRTGWLSEHWLNTPVASNQHVSGEPTCGAAPDTLPAEPGSPRVASTSSSSAVLTWTDASNNETGFATQYKIGNGGWVAGPTAGANATSVTIPGLSPSTPYTFQVGAQNSAGTHWSAYATGNTSAAGTTSTPPPPTGPVLNYQVTNYDNDGTTGVYLRNSSNINDVVRDGAHFVPYGTTVTLLCGGSGSSVGPYSNTAWDYVRVSDGRTGWISEHWLNTPVSSNQHVAGEPNC